LPASALPGASVLRPAPLRTAGRELVEANPFRSGVPDFGRPKEFNLARLPSPLNRITDNAVFDYPVVGRASGAKFEQSRPTSPRLPQRIPLLKTEELHEFSTLAQKSQMFFDAAPSDSGKTAHERTTKDRNRA
jgi:hypothetical protein